MRANCPWRLLRGELLPWGTMDCWFATFRDNGRFERINHALIMAHRERAGSGASPTGAIIGSQSVKVAEADLLTYAAGELAAYKRPSRIVVVDTLPASSTGKILKAGLKDRAAALE
jgi:acyl-CoA synthetase (AMP-forming)/AMP-acid ligase II